jgi:hypothetical protein
MYKVQVLFMAKLITLHGRIISQRWDVWANETSLIPPLLIEVPIANQENEQSCDRGINFAYFYDISIVF